MRYPVRKSMKDKNIGYEFFAVEMNSYYGAVITIVGKTKNDVRKQAKDLNRENYIWEIRKHKMGGKLPYITLLKSV